MGKSNRSLSITHPNAAGIDIGASTHFVAVPDDRDPVPVQSFKCFTPDLHRLAKWLKACNIDTVAMESTGVYWIPLFQILEKHGFEILLVNARHVKNVPGRKTDVQDCQWLQQLHSFGLLRGSFRPNDAICVLRSYVRQRDNLIKSASTHVLRMQKCFSEMNVQLHRVISDITGVTGTSIIEAILSGERDPIKLAKFRNPHIKCKESELIDALTGDYREEHLFVLSQEYALYKTYQTKLAECDRAIEAYYQQFEAQNASPKNLPALGKRHKRKQKNGPHYDLREVLYRVTGNDFTVIPGLDTLSIQNIIAEVGLDPTRWRTEKHFVSWLGLSPANKISGGKILSSRTRKVVNRAAIAFRIAANTLSRTQTGLGAFCRRLKGRLGAPKAITATARKIAILFYQMLRYNQSYVEKGVEYYEKRYENRVLRNLEKKAELMGYSLVKSEGAMA